MTYIHRDEVREHQEVSVFIPWYVNGTLGEHDRRRVDAHLLQCETCRNELALDLGVYRSITVEPAVEYMPAASLKRLQARLDSMDAKADVPAVALATGKAPRRPMPWQGLIAASVAVMAVAISMLATDRWLQYRARAAAPNYYTVTSPIARAPDEVIRAVFSPTITLDELQSILDEAHLRIVSGPTEAGVYSLAANSSRPVSASLAQLRAHAKVRFAESTQPSKGPSDLP
jgi:hypothetical protein